MRKNHRRTGRPCGEGLECNLGRIVNVSAGGMVVRGRLPDTDQVEVRLGSEDDAPVVTLKRIWTRFASFRTQECGYSFVDAPPDLVQKLWGVKMPETRDRVL